ncbi:MAG: hypothetical protein F6K11_05030 [Leptolyngbya sp. SIO3F4]|nr:hypothetical protein [Leptolyngbya sp. SIO3F4]
MITAIAITNIAIALICLALARHVTRFSRQVIQLNRDLNRWTVLLEETLANQTLVFTQKRTDLRKWQLIHLQWQLQQRRIMQVAKLIKLVSLFAGQRLL